MNLTRLKKINLIWVWLVTVPIFIWGFLFGNLTNPFKFFLLIIAASFYLLMTIVHHYLEKSLNLEIVVEYVLIAILSVIILYSLLL